MNWECQIDGCEAVFEEPESAVVHQALNHERAQCQICGSVVPDGYLAIRHVFTEHSRAEYVRSYDANSEDVRIREEVLEEIEPVLDMKDVANQLQD